MHKLSPSVVQIQSPDGLGSGVVFDTNGDIVTNNHVVAGDGPYTVTAGAHTYGASLVGRFAPDDLAVVRVSGAKLAPAAFADSSKLEVGDIAIAIGNPLGLQSSVTDGIVSAFRPGVSEGNGVALPSMIQTSAAINPGNSGGALVDIAGPRDRDPDARRDRSAARRAPRRPASASRSRATSSRTSPRQIIRFGHVVNSHRAYLGVQIGNTNGAGVLVLGVTKGGPADKAGLVANDLITSVAGKRTPTIDDLTSALSEIKPRTTVTVGVVTQGGAHKTLHLTAGQYPGS